MKRLLAGLLVGLALMGSVPVAPARADPPGSVTWVVDHKAKTITVTVKLQIYSGCSGASLGSAEQKARACTGAGSQVSSFLAQKIKSQAEKVWNRNYHYRCYRLIVIVDVTIAADRDHVDADRVGVRIDPSPAGVRDYVNHSFGFTHYNSNDPADRSDPSNSGLEPTTWSENHGNKDSTYAHELGHVMGLNDGYDEKTMQPYPDAPVDLMSTNKSFLTQATINRLVERNSDRLYDKNGNKVSLDDLVCEPQFRVTLTGKQAEYDASNIFDSNVKPPCTPETITSSKDQSLKIASSAPVDVRVVAAPDTGAGSYTLVPNFDALTLVGGATPGVRPPTAAGFFDMPINVQVTRSNDKPANGPTPAVLNVLDVPCAGGSQGASPPPKDCGVRSYDAWVAMAERNGGDLWPVSSSLPSILKDLGYSEARLDKLYRNCSGNTPWPGAFVDQGGGTVTTGAMPTLQRLQTAYLEWATDGVPDRIDITGSAVLNTNVPGTLKDYSFEWTLTLCPINKDGEVPPNCP